MQGPSAQQQKQQAAASSSKQQQAAAASRPVRHVCLFEFLFLGSTKFCITELQFKYKKPTSL
jgi:hypothetical protein